MKRAIFLDRDGTVNAGIPKYERVDSVDKVEILDGAIEGLRKLAKSDYLLFFVTNQAGLAEGLITRADFNAINNKTLADIESSEAVITETYICPHGKDEDCDCRKPSPKMLKDAASKYDLDLTASWMVGDRQTDIDTGRNAGTRTVLTQTGSIMMAEGADFIAKDLSEAADYILANS